MPKEAPAHHWPGTRGDAASLLRTLFPPPPTPVSHLQGHCAGTLHRLCCPSWALRYQQPRNEADLASPSGCTIPPPPPLPLHHHRSKISLHSLPKITRRTSLQINHDIFLRSRKKKKKKRPQTGRHLDTFIPPRNMPPALPTSGIGAPRCARDSSIGLPSSSLRLAPTRLTRHNAPPQPTQPPRPDYQTRSGHAIRLLRTSLRRLGR